MEYWGRRCKVKEILGTRLNDYIDGGIMDIRPPQFFSNDSIAEHTIEQSDTRMNALSNVIQVGVFSLLFINFSLLLKYCLIEIRGWIFDRWIKFFRERDGGGAEDILVVHYFKKTISGYMTLLYKFCYILLICKCETYMNIFSYIRFNKKCDRWKVELLKSNLKIEYFSLLHKNGLIVVLKCA